ncbi:MOSC domain-containing protein [Gracilibacillus dipsosauri]|uniref:MOSC domain-containing protein n=1 Tax=Gracilibacillus dipsosauri TaxID=178340 RepID=A0A317L1X4_9BACI|nr:MOSC domain-containing protein [Gracilibacillus dipsosauri]PWU69812.1 MOSC domain-containing protein [Gracilibacillus dipsosauri]
MNPPIIRKLLTGKVKKLGSPEAKDKMDREWESAIFKQSVEGRKWLSKTGLAGDEVADTKNHGGLEKAIFAYSTHHYDYWRKEQGIEKIGIGAMGENLAVESLDEQRVCIGDTYRFGEAVIQVAQPRRPCWKPARRYRIMDFALQIQETGRTGWYFRVLEEGYVQAEQELILLERPYPKWTIAQCNEVMYRKKDDLALVEELASCPFLAESWKETLSKRLKGKKTSSSDKRVFGPNKN